MPVQARPGATLKVIEAEFLFQLLVSLFADPTRFDSSGERVERDIGRKIGQVIFALAV